MHSNDYAIAAVMMGYTPGSPRGRQSAAGGLGLGFIIIIITHLGL